HHVDIPATNDICQEVRLYSTVVQGHSRAIDVTKAKGECIDTVLGGIGRQRGFSDTFALGVAGPRREMLQCALSVFSDEICAFDRSVDLRGREQNEGTAARVDECVEQVVRAK